MTACPWFVRFKRSQSKVLRLRACLIRNEEILYRCLVSARGCPVPPQLLHIVPSLYFISHCLDCRATGAADFVRVFHEYQYLPSVINEGDLADYTVRKWRELASQSAAGAKSLISCTPDETILSLLREFVQSNLTRIPVLSIEEAYSIQDTSTIGRGPESQGKGDGSSRDKIDDSLEPAIIHLATVSDILACISLHFERILESLPLLDLPIGALSDHIGTWGNVRINQTPPLFSSPFSFFDVQRVSDSPLVPYCCFFLFTLD